MKKISLLLLLLLLSVPFSACSKKQPVDGTIPEEGQNETVSFAVSDIASDLIDNGDFPDMYTMSDSEIERQFGFSAGQFSEVYAAAADQYPGIERIFIGKLENSDDKNEIVDALNRYLETLKAEYIDYVPSEYDKAKDVSVYEKGDYVCLVIAGDSDAALKIVKNYIK